MLQCKESKAEVNPDMRKVVCLNSEQGCPCKTDNGEFRIFHAEAARVTGPSVGGLLEIVVRGKSCRYPASALVVMPYAPVLTSPWQKADHSPMAVDRLTGISRTDLDQAERFSLGRFWPTFYHLALEEFYPGQDVPILSADGRVLGRASDQFLQQVTWEGSGISRTGLRLAYAGPGRYSTYKSDVWGYGAGGRTQILPYRTIAVNFPGLCKRLSPKAPCTAQTIPGIMLFVPELAKKKIRMQDGSFHDGYLCATDTGSPYYIREDRIDMFVGSHGGGNPFLPMERQLNDYIRGGLEAILPSDFRVWTGVNERVWCSPELIPKDPFHPAAGECKIDYHVVAAHKSLEMFALIGKDGKPLRCLGSPPSPGPHFPDGKEPAQAQK